MGAPEGDLKPLYRLVSEQIVADIRRGVYLDVLPPQEELARTYKVGRSTIREALRRLEDQGMIRVRHGAPTKIVDVNRSLAIQPGLESFVGLTRLLESSGHQPGTSWVKVRRTYATSFLFAPFNGKPIIVLERLRTADDIPVVFSTDAFLDRGWNLQDLEQEMMHSSLLDFLAREGARVQYSETVVRAQMPDADVIRHLQLEDEQPVLVLDEISYGDDGTIVNCSTDYYHPTHISFRVIRRAEQQTP
ncbi:MAG: GntR family transcriptional regulator [Alicyclobacillus sp.]|nr:GntR family transcriptional regulator [Alicyclobacillus sp.]